MAIQAIRWGGAAFLVWLASGCGDDGVGATETSGSESSAGDESGTDTDTTTDDTGEVTEPTPTGSDVGACHDESGAPVFEHESGAVGSETWTSGVHLLKGGIQVGGLLTVEPCSVIKVPDGASIEVVDGGALRWVGTAEETIRVTSAKPTGAPGDWVEIDIRATSSGPDNVFRFVTLEYGGGAKSGALWIENGASIAISDTTIRDSGDFGLVADGTAELRDFAGNTLQDNASGALRIAPNGAGQLGVGTYAPNHVDGIVIDGAYVDHDQTWLTHDAHYIAPHGFSVHTDAGSAHLTVSAGATIELGSESTVEVAVNGGLTMVGTAEQPITLTSSKAAGAPGDWIEVDIRAASADDFNRFEHVIIEHGGGSTYGQVWVEKDASIALTNVTIRDGADVAVTNYGEVREFTGNTLTGNAKGAVRTGANQVDQLLAGTYGPNGVEGIIVNAELVDHDATWLALGVPLLASTGFGVRVDAGSARLVVDAGVDLRLGDSAVIDVGNNGALRLAGTADAPVKITSAKPAPAPGDWAEIDINDDSVGPDNVFSYAEIAYGGASTYGQVFVANSAELTLDHVTFASAGKGCDVHVEDGLVNAMSTDFVPCP